MRAAFTSLMLILSMLFGSLVVPAFADAGTAGHAFEILDTDCHAETRDDARDAPGTPANPPQSTSIIIIARTGSSRRQPARRGPGFAPAARSFPCRHR